MGLPVRYRGYDIVCSETGYTIFFNDVDVMTGGSGDAGRWMDCQASASILEQARRTVDRLIGDDSGRRG